MDDVSLHVDAGRGRGTAQCANGAGSKMTTIRMLLGLSRPTAGEALLDGAPPTRESRRRLGYVPQGTRPVRELTVTENLAFAARAFGCEPATLEPPLADDADTLVASLPLGLRRRLAFLCALQHGPDVLILDEPTSGSNLWQGVCGTGSGHRPITVSVCSSPPHYMQEARQWTGCCSRCPIYRLVAQGSERDIVDGTRSGGARRGLGEGVRRPGTAAWR